jgi:hypothetical protein
VARRPPMPGGGGIGRPLGPMGGRGAGGGGTGLPEGLIGGRGAARSGAGAAGATSMGGAAAAAAAGAGTDSGAGAAAGATVSLVTGRAGGRDGADVLATAGAEGAAVGAGAGGGALGAAVGRLLISRGALTSPVLVAGAVEVVAPAVLAAAVFDAAVEVADELDLTTVFLVAGAGSASTGAGASGWTSRRSPSASALRRTRSAWASSMEDEWLLTPMPRERASSSPSLLLRPNSLANS